MYTHLYNSTSSITMVVTLYAEPMMKKITEIWKPYRFKKLTAPSPQRACRQSPGCAGSTGRGRSLSRNPASWPTSSAKSDLESSARPRPTAMGVASPRSRCGDEDAASLNRRRRNRVVAADCGGTRGRRND